MKKVLLVAALLSFAPSCFARLTQEQKLTDFSRAESGKATSMAMQSNFNLRFMAGPSVTGPSHMACSTPQNDRGAL